MERSFLVLLYGIGAYLTFLTAFIIRMLVAFGFLYWINNLVDKEKPLYQKIIKPFLEVGAIVFVVYDVILNWCLTFLLLEGPRWPTETVSERLGHYLKTKDPSSFKYKFAKFFCNILTHADPNHCGKFADHEG